jgi:hypothetical protein
VGVKNNKCKTFKICTVLNFLNLMYFW